jgi:hypothetical protein
MLSEMAFTLVVCREKQIEIAAAYRDAARTRRHVPIQPLDDEDAHGPFSARDASAAHLTFLTGLKPGTKPTDRATDIAAYQLCKDMRMATGGPQHGVVAQMLLCAGLLSGEGSTSSASPYSVMRQNVINRVKKASAGTDWPHWTQEWQ